MSDTSAAPAVGAFFDLDRTVLSASSGALWTRYLRREGRIGLRQTISFAWYALLYRLAVVDMAALTRRLAWEEKGHSEAELIAESERWFAEMVAPCIAPLARKRVEQHLAQGHIVALLTASSPYVSRPVAHSLGLGDRFICTRLEVKAGVFTGRCLEPICFGAGKVHWARIFAAEHGIDLAHSYFYSDSYTDLPMLQAVGHPVAVNPDTRLRRLAARRGWPEERFY